MWDTSTYIYFSIKWSISFRKYILQLLTVNFKNIIIYGDQQLYKVLFIIIFEREGRKEEREGENTDVCERNMNGLPLDHPQWGTWPVTKTCALSGDQTSDPSVHRPALNPFSHTTHGRTMILKVFIQLSTGQQSEEYR